MKYPDEWLLQLTGMLGCEFDNQMRSAGLAHGFTPCDESWQCSHADATWRPARLASKPKLVPVGSPIRSGEELWTSMQTCRPKLALFAVLSATVCRLVGYEGPVFPRTQGSGRSRGEDGFNPLTHRAKEPGS